MANLLGVSMEKAFSFFKANCHDPLTLQLFFYVNLLSIYCVLVKNVLVHATSKNLEEHPTLHSNDYLV